MDGILVLVQRSYKMGNCMSDSTVTFNEDYVNKPPNAEQISADVASTDRPRTVVMLTDEALLDNKTDAIEIVMQSNDIGLPSKSEIERHSSVISKHAIKKLATRVNSDYEVNVVKLAYLNTLGDKKGLNALFTRAGVGKATAK
jgi:hypothetical protein